MENLGISEANCCLLWQVIRHVAPCRRRSLSPRRCTVSQRSEEGYGAELTNENCTCIFNRAHTCAPVQLSALLSNSSGNRAGFSFSPVSLPLLLSSLALSISLSMNLSRSLLLTRAGRLAVILTNKSWQLCAGANINASLPGGPPFESVSIKQSAEGFLFTNHRRAD